MVTILQGILLTYLNCRSDYSHSRWRFDSQDLAVIPLTDR